MQRVRQYRADGCYGDIRLQLSHISHGLEGGIETRFLTHPVGKVCHCSFLPKGYVLCGYGLTMVVISIDGFLHIVLGA